MVMLVVLTFLVEAAAAHRKFRLTAVAPCGLCSAIVLDARGLLFDLSCIGHVRLPFEFAQLLLVGLLATKLHFTRTAVAIASWRSPAPVADLRLVDAGAFGAA